MDVLLAVGAVLVIKVAAYTGVFDIQVLGLLVNLSHCALGPQCDRVDAIQHVGLDGGVWRGELALGVLARHVPPVVAGHTDRAESAFSAGDTGNLVDGAAICNCRAGIQCQTSTRYNPDGYDRVGFTAESWDAAF